MCAPATTPETHPIAEKTGRVLAALLLQKSRAQSEPHASILNFQLLQPRSPANFETATNSAHQLEDSFPTRC